jgi:A/G-specific adenine glycosylase
MTAQLDIQLFQETVWSFYRDQGRHDLQWRLPQQDGRFDPYKIMVSEIMLQQTQVSRVTTKYEEFVALFPTVQDLAAAKQGDVLRAWSGLGYNRRAKYLHQAAQVIVDQYAGNFPQTVAELIQLPGVGKNTAGAVLAYAFNLPAVFVETNIRTVVIHNFFAEASNVSDADIAAVVEASVDSEHPREWYWALMDYGSYLKQTVGNLNKLSKTYAKQTTFKGSKRQIRGQVLKLLASKPHEYQAVEKHVTDERLPIVLQELLAEGLIREEAGGYCL